MSGWWEGPSVELEQQLQNVETWKDLKYYKDIISDLREEWGEGLSKETLAPLMKAIDEAEFNDSLKKELFWEITSEIEKIKEPVKSQLLQLAESLQSDNTEIPEWADIVKISEYIWDEWVREIFLEMTSEDLDWPMGAISSRMVIWEEMQWVITSIESEWEEKAKQLDEITSENSSNSTWENVWKTIMDVGNEAIAEIYGNEKAEAFEAAYSKVQNYVENLWYLTVHVWESINMDRVDIQRYIMAMPEKVNDSNKDEIIAKLLEISWNEFDQNDAIEDIIENTNNLDPEIVKSFSELRDEWGKAFAELLIEKSNNWEFWYDYVIQFFQDAAKNWGIWKMVVEFFFWKEGLAAISESNLKKQKALFNLVKISSEEWEWFKIAGTDFSKISWDDLKWFFASMDSHGVDYSRENFWESFLSGEVQEGTEYDAAVSIREKILEGDADFFNFKENGGFSNENEGFKGALNNISLKLDQDEWGVQDGEWNTYATNDDEYGFEDRKAA